MTGWRKVADSQSSIFKTLAPIRGGSDDDIAPLGNAASLESGWDHLGRSQDL
jgi:hypothetical protein